MQLYQQRGGVLFASDNTPEGTVNIITLPTGVYYCDIAGGGGSGSIAPGGQGGRCIIGFRVLYTTQVKLNKGFASGYGGEGGAGTGGGGGAVLDLRVDKEPTLEGMNIDWVCAGGGGGGSGDWGSQGSSGGGYGSGACSANSARFGGAGAGYPRQSIAWKAGNGFDGGRPYAWSRSPSLLGGYCTNQDYGAGEAGANSWNMSRGGGGNRGGRGGWGANGWANIYKLS